MPNARPLLVPYRLARALVAVDFRRIYENARGSLRFARTMREYGKRATGAFALRVRDLYPILGDFEGSAGTASGDYFHQDLWAARKIFQRQPGRHVDIGSRIDGFVAHLLVFMPVDVVDVRPLRGNVAGLNFVQSDGATLASFPDNSVESLSSLHAVEHFGLGRYGDPVDPDACFRAMNNLARILRPDGHLYFSVPIGKERVEFNAQRVFSPQTILAHFGALKLLSFCAVDAKGDFVPKCQPSEYANADRACGLFEFTK